MLKEERFDSHPFDNRPRVKNRLNILPENPEADDPDSAVGLGRFPSWLHRKLPKGAQLKETGAILNRNRMPTVCEEAKCPNLLECWSRKTATFLALGKQCTRNCGFCDIDFSKNPQPLEVDEPARIAQAVQELSLRHVVVTMVARDDLSDGGAEQMAAIVKQLRTQASGVVIELLTSDFNGNRAAWNLLLSADFDIFNYNVETVRELTPRVRHTATYERTLEFLAYAKAHNPKRPTKSGMMVGLGETEEQVQETLRDLKQAGCDIVTIGQYLQSNRHKLRVKAFIPPEQFKKYEIYGHSIGISQMFCGPFVRSSYHAEEPWKKMKSV